MKYALIFSALLFASLFTIQSSLGEESDLFCNDGKVLVYRVNAEKYACLNPPTAESWYKSGISEPVDQITSIESKVDTTPLHPEKMVSAAPVPESAIGPQIDFSKGFLVEEISDDLYWITEGAYQGMFLVTGEGVIVVDAPPSIGQNYLKAIEEVTDEPITHVIYSHSHIDHIGAASMFPENATIISHKWTAEKLKLRDDPNRPVPTVTFEDKYTLEVGNQTLELEYNGPIHAPGNIFIYAPQQKVLMVVDVIFPGWVPFKDLAMAEDVPFFLYAHDKILEYDFETFIGGHLNRLGTPEDVKIQKEYFDDVQKYAGSANLEVDFMEIGQKVGFENLWLVFQIYADTVTQQCSDEVVPKWIDRLGGADLFTYDHCWKISESQRID
ncbi:MAG TPA: MBL fold metallo-hydrolase [Nitrosopumilaceae archaeon]|nr:MBL fold metallo-hydrolase [Nitrosopumilaceae archaeon]